MTVKDSAPCAKEQQSAPDELPSPEAMQVLHDECDPSVKPLQPLGTICRPCSTRTACCCGPYTTWRRGAGTWRHGQSGCVCCWLLTIGESSEAGADEVAGLRAELENSQEQ
eukprot:223501-Amphidinium_carterae.1